MRIGVFIISLVIMIALGSVLNYLFFAFAPIEAGGEINWVAGIIGLGIIAALILAGIYFIIKFKKTL